MPSANTNVVRGYHLYPDVVDEAQELETALQQLPEVRSVTLTGTMRRKMEVVNELVFVVACAGEVTGRE